ncbi:hypothetical protein NIES4074_29160 [Cylindrospermum sp. NIES-4074]|nr:hypothetical protein NIES4074_29160 [Cylindrospermum sp. NIES-4074]
MNKSDDLIRKAEQEIDSAFLSNKLKNIGYTQAVWTLLSVVEDHHLRIRVVEPMSDEQLQVYIDNLINWLSYPLRICLKEAVKNSNKLTKVLINEHYGLAQEWIEKSKQYWNFCLIFPLWYRKKIQISVIENKLIPTDCTTLELEYEAYNRLVKKSGDGAETRIDLNKVTQIVIDNTEFNNKHKIFKVNFNSHLASELIALCNEVYLSKYNLPEEWQFSGFTISQFKSIFITTQALSLAWYIARVEAARGRKGLAYSSSIWVVKKQELITHIARYSKQPRNVVKNIYDKITFGNAGIRHPDIATQPLIDLYNSHYAISPFIWLNVDAERNLCVLLNQIESEKTIYSKLVENKESILKDEFIKLVRSLSFDCKYGSKESTDVDLAIIDRQERLCLVMELKWFIEPAEIRECHDRSEELVKSVKQALKIKNAYRNSDRRLIEGVLNIEPDYELMTIVVSKNWIGHFDVQNLEVPIIKSGDLMRKLESSRSLSETISWLKLREYLPKRGKDFHVGHVNIQLGDWQSKWYGIKPI